MNASRHHLQQSPLASARNAFTLVELLVVISILGLLAALSVPAIKNIGKATVATSASQQLLDDVARARQLAMSRRTTVYMVFLPANYWLPPYVPAGWLAGLTTQDAKSITNLSENQLSGYAFVSRGQLGDQPGRHDWQYISTWQSLPDNNFIALWKFQPRAALPISVNGAFSVYGFSTNAFPFPATNNSYRPLLPFIAFNHLGQLTMDGVNPSYVDEYIPLAQGNVNYGYNGQTKMPTLTSLIASDVVESPQTSSTGSMFTLVHIDALTGRARLEFQKVAP